MIALDEAQRRLLALARPVSVETLPLSKSVGRWAAEDVVARRTQPARDLSAMDGYAIRHVDAPGPWSVIGQSAAGAAFNKPIGAHEAVRIFTGAALPDGADTVVMQEDMAVEGETVRLNAPDDLRKGRHVRKAGEDFASGNLLISAGERLNPARIALAAMGGYGALAVQRPIRVALISTGDELVVPGQPTADDQIPASNGVMLAAMLNSFPCEVTDFGIVPDDIDVLTETFRNAKGADLIISTGGASVGDHDHVKPALEAAGATLDFWKIAMRPGKPLMAGTLGDAVVLGLPGNPVSAFVTAILFAQPVIAALSGAASPFPKQHVTRLSAPLPAVAKRTDHVRAKLDNGVVTPIGLNDSAALNALSQANALIVRPAGSTAAAAGDDVKIILIA